MESPVLHITEADLVRDVRTILQRVEAGAEIVIERDARPVAVLRSVVPPRRKISECIALAKAHEADAGTPPTLDPDFAAAVEDIVNDRQPWNAPVWD